MKVHKGKNYAWVNETLIDGVIYTMWRSFTDPTDMQIADYTKATKKEKVTENKDKDQKDEWKKITDKKPPKPVTPTPDPKPKGSK